MRMFDLRKAKNGDAVVTKSNKDVKILLFDRDSTVFPLVAIINNKQVACYTSEGKFYRDKDSDNDLRMK